MRRRMVIGGLVVALVAGLLVLLVMRDEDLPALPSAPSPAETPTPTPEPEPVADASGLLYLDGTVLLAADLDTGERTRIAELPSGDAALSQDGSRIAVVRETHPQGPGPEGFRSPEIAIGPVGGDLAPAGAGRDPTWSPDGTKVAAVQVAEGYNICDAGEDVESQEEAEESESCVEGERIVAYDAATGASAAALGADRWSIAGWSGGEVLGLGRLGFGVALGAPGEAFEDVERLSELRVPQVWGVSPTERIVLVVRDGNTYLHHLDGGDEVTVDVQGRLGDGTWSPDGSTIVAVVLGRGATQLVAIDAQTGAVTEVEGGTEAAGNVVWDASGSRFAYVRVAPNRPGRLQAMVCTADLACEPAFMWTEGVTLLGFGPMPTG